MSLLAYCLACEVITQEAVHEHIGAAGAVEQAPLRHGFEERAVSPGRTALACQQDADGVVLDEPPPAK